MHRPHIPHPLPLPKVTCDGLRIHQVLARHLDSLVGPGKLDGIHKALVACLAVWIRDADQVSSLGGRKKVTAQALCAPR